MRFTISQAWSEIMPGGTVMWRRRPSLSVMSFSSSGEPEGKLAYQTKLRRRSPGLVVPLGPAMVYVRSFDFVSVRARLTR